MFRRPGRELTERQIAEARVLGGPVGLAAPVDLNYRLTSGISIGATAAPINRVPAGMTGYGGYLLIDPFNINAEIRAVESISGGIVQWTSSLSYAHSSNAPALWLTEPTLNVKWWNAKGDGLTDDSTAVNRAIIQASGLGGGVVYFPWAIYYALSAAITPKDNVVLMSDGRGRTILKRASGYSSHVLLDTNGVDNFGIVGMTIDGLSDASGSNLVEFRDATNLYFDRVSFTNALYALLMLDGCDGVDVVACHFRNSRRSGVECTYDNSSSGIISSNVVIDRCLFEDLTTIAVAGVKVRDEVGGATFNNIHVTNCTFLSTIADTAIGIFQADGDNFMISNCLCNVTLANIFLRGATYGGLTNVTVNGNSISSISDGGVFIIFSQGFEVVGNTIRGCDFEGLSISSSRHGTVTGNNIINNGQASTTGREAGIRFTYTTSISNKCTDVVVSGNRIGDTHAYASKTQQYGIDLQGDEERIEISANNLQGNKIKPINDLGGSTANRHFSCFYHGNRGQDLYHEAASENLFLSGSFEAWSGGGSSAPDNWATATYASGSAGSVAQEATTIKFGAYSVKLTQTNTTGKWFLRPSAALALDPNEDYVAYVWVYIPSTNTPAEAGIGIDSLGPNTFSYSGLADLNLTDQWQLVPIHFNTGSDGAGRVFLWVQADNANDYAFFDGAMLVRGTSIPAFRT